MSASKARIPNTRQGRRRRNHQGAKRSRTPRLRVGGAVDSGEGTGGGVEVVWAPLATSCIVVASERRRCRVPRRGDSDKETRRQGDKRALPVSLSPCLLVSLSSSGLGAEPPALFQFD